MKRNQGFTLIELLAVIIILAVIALIATPIVLNVVDKAKENSRQSSVAGYADAAKLYVYDEQFKSNGQVPSNEDIKNNTTNQGDKVVCGKDGELPGTYYSNEYGIVLHGCTVGDNEKLYYFASGKTYTKDENGKLPEEYINIINSIKGPQVSNIVYFNPVTNQVCTDYVETNSNTGVKTGCMKWYIYKIDGDNVGLLLDHNTTATVAWASQKDCIADGGSEVECVYNGKTDKGPLTLLKKLKDDTIGNGWTVSEIDIISTQDIAKITGYESDWTISNSWFYFDNNSTIKPSIYKYGWLYDRSSEDCVIYGCLNNSNVWTKGYWTKDQYGNNTDWPWNVYFDGRVYLYHTAGNSNFGVRPVITISKSLIK